MELQPNISHWMVQHVEIADPMKPKMANGKILLETLQSVDYIHYETALKAFTEDETEGVMIRLVAVEQEEDQKFFLTLRQKRIFTEEEFTKQRRRQILGRQLKEREAWERRNDQQGKDVLNGK